MARIFHMSLGSRIGLVASALLMTALNLSAQQAGDADWGPSLPMDELQKMAGTQVSCTVLRIVPSETFPELGNELAQEESVVIVQAGSTRALVVPSGQTQFRVGQNYKLSLQYRTKLTPPSRLGLPNPVGVYNETLYRDRVLYRIARVEALDKELDAYLSPGFLNRFVVPAERIAEITPQMLDRGLKNPLVEQTSHFFVKVPSDRYQIAEVLQPDANFEVRLVHASTGNR
ncbi:MAG: hypothetical protein U1E27_07775, partial [Kiritimatiellia bacterium]|nr:hypothetical protein [Kiritimatiellia bacterium]